MFRTDRPDFAIAVSLAIVAVVMLLTARPAWFQWLFW
jgi:hypothetical protein